MIYDWHLISGKAGGGGRITKLSTKLVAFMHKKRKKENIKQGYIPQ